MRKNQSKRIARAGDWYDKNRDLHERYALKLRTLISELLSLSKVQFHSIEFRVKTRESFLKKCQKQDGKKLKYSDPVGQISDVVGVRIITYLDATIDTVGKLLSDEFLVDIGNSPDKDLELGIDRVGYRSKHFIVKLDHDRSALVEYRDFMRLRCEVQVRSLLQHAWAEVEHDRRFKYPGELPHEIRRRYSLIAGQLELADRELNNLAREVDAMTNSVATTSTAEASAISIGIDAVNAYLRGAFSSAIQSGVLEPTLMNSEKQLIKELTSFGIRNLKEFSDLVSSRDPKLIPLVPMADNFLGLIRQAMLLRDAKAYFEKSWKKSWHGISQDEIALYKTLGVDLMPLLRKYKLGITDD